jgi:hypothetical protein
MGWAIVSVLGFVAVTGLVTAMARSNTARWERDHRAPQAAIRAHERAVRHGWLTTLAHWEEHGGAPARRPHLHLPHVHLPDGLVQRLPHPHVPALHLPSLHLPSLHLPRRSGSVPPSGSSSVAPEEPAGDRTGAAS